MFDWQSASGSRDGVRVDLVGDPYGGGETENFLNRAAFRLAPTGRFGNLERNSLRSPATYAFSYTHLTLSTITDAEKIQFAAELIKHFNTQQWGQPDTNFYTKQNKLASIQGTQ